MTGEEGITRVLVTGGSGFIGTNLVEFYLRAGVEVLNVDHSPPRNRAHATVWQEIDLEDYERLRAVIKEFAPTHVLHMGARTDLAGRAAEEYAANTTGVENMIAALEAVPAVGRVIFASSRMVCRIGYQPRHDSDYCPTTAYGESKVQMERIVRSRARQQVWTIVRPSSIWGPWFGVPYKDFFLAIAHGRYFHVGRRPIYKSFGYVGNTVYQLHKLLVAPATEVQRRTLYVADYPPLEVKHWAEGIRASLDAPPIRTLPYPVLRAAAMAGDVLRRAGWREVPLTRFRLDNLLTEMVYDLRPLEKIVGRLPNSLQQGTLETITWLRRQGEVPT